MVKFLQCAGFPWLALRQAPRSNDFKVTDTSWMYFLPHFDIAGKYNYKQMCALTTRLQQQMLPSVKAWYDSMRTASWHGHIGCNMYWDQIQETANNLIKPFMGEVSDEKLGECVTRLNGIKEVESRMRQLLGSTSSADEIKATSVEQNDVIETVNELKKALGSTFDEFCQRRSNVFKGADQAGRTRSGHAPDINGPSKPWELIERVRASDELRLYLDDVFTHAPQILAPDE